MTEELTNSGLKDLEKKFLEQTQQLGDKIQEMKIAHQKEIQQICQEHEKDRDRIRAQEYRIQELKEVIQKMKDEESIFEESEEEEEEVEGENIPKVVPKVDENAKMQILHLLREEKVIMKKESKLKKFTQILSFNQFKELERVCGFNKNSWRRIYSAKKNGFSARKFHQKCDDNPKTLVFIQTTRKKRVLGGYNPLRWNETGSFNNQWYDAKGAYIFGFENIQEENGEHVEKIVKFEYDGKGYGIRCNPHMGPCFGGPSTYALRVSNDCHLSNSSFTKLEKSGYPNKDRGAFFLNGGKKGNFKVADYEVFVKI